MFYTQNRVPYSIHNVCILSDVTNGIRNNDMLFVKYYVVLFASKPCYTQYDNNVYDTVTPRIFKIFPPFKGNNN